MLIRKYESQDKEFVLSLAPRFVSFGFLDFRNPLEMLKKNEEMIIESINTNASNIYVAKEDDFYLGYIELKGWVDYFTKKKQGYISAIAITEDCEGEGVGKLLLKKAEEWAKQKGYSELVLQVFSENEKAINLYKQNGYESDCIVMVKEL